MIRRLLSQPHPAAVRSRRAAFAACLLLGVSLPGLALAAPDTDAPVALAAEEVTHDRSLDIVTARGEVEINQAGYTLYADTVSYNVGQDMVSASGNVSLIAPDGQVVFADYMQLTGKMKQGAIENLLMVSADLSRTAARTGTRRVGERGQQINELGYAVYSACDTCEGKENPLWQIKAAQVIHDEGDHDVTYRDATIEMWGVPVAYTPYISMPDPTVKRRSGLLFPSGGTSSNLGLFYAQPYYWVISDTADATITPLLAVDEPSIMIGQYRQNFADASIVIDASGRAGGTIDDTDGSSAQNTRGHFDLKGEWDVNDVWRGTADLHAVSSDTYLRRYGLPRSTDYQTSRVALEGFDGDDYAAVEAVAFRELRNLSNPPKNPYAVPLAQWVHTSDPGVKGGYWTTQLSTASLTRTDGADSSRVSAASAWTLPYVAPSGEHYTLSASLRGDAYQVNNYTMLDGEEFTGTTGRIVPEVSMRWSWPFASPGERTTQVIEPVLIGALSPNGGNSSKIPNEDSRDLDFDDTQLLSTNHFVGYDRVETGPRATYGVNWNTYVNGTPSKFSVFGGQTFRTREDNVFPDGSGIRDGFSDLVGRVRYDYGSAFSTFYRFRVDPDGLNVVSHDVTAYGGNEVLRLGVSYLKQDYSTRADYETTTDANVEQIAFSLSSHILRDWSVSLGTTHSLTGDDSGPLSFSAGLAYEDECFIIRGIATNDYTADRDADSGWGMMVTLTFKTLGDSKFSM